MYKRLVAGVKRALGLHHPGRNLIIFPDDVFLVSYPKSGNTWTRFLIGNLLYPEKHPDFSNINLLVPDPEALPKRVLDKLPRPRALKSHHCFDPNYPRVIYIVRDPRDVVLSEYHFDIKRGALEENFPIETYVKRFTRGEVNHKYGSWGENAASWYYTRENSERFLLVTYESLLSDGMAEMARIAEFLKVSGDRERLAFAIEQSSADRMRDLEKRQAHLWSSTRQTRKDKPFVRAAKAEGWRSQLPRSSVLEIEKAWGELMVRLGYKLATERLAEEVIER